MYYVYFDRNNTFVTVPVMDIVRTCTPYEVNKPGFYIDQFIIYKAEAAWNLGALSFMYPLGVEVSRSPERREPTQRSSWANNVPLYLHQSESIDVVYKTPTKLTYIILSGEYLINYLVTETTTTPI